MAPLILILGGLTLAVVLLVLVLFVLFMTRGGARAGNAADEARVMQEIYQSLQKMEARIEVLETMLIEREKAKQIQASDVSGSASA